MIQTVEDVLNVLLITPDPDLADTFSLMLSFDRNEVSVADPRKWRLLPAPRSRPDLLYVDLRLQSTRVSAYCGTSRAHAWKRTFPP